MYKLRTMLAVTAIICLAIGTANAQVDMFARSAVIAPPADTAGWGEAVAGVDFDGDGKTEIYAVNTNMYDGAGEMVPHIYKYELDAGVWTMVWSTPLAVPLQNTWPALTSGDLDGDGKMEIIYGPVNFINATTNPKPTRIHVFEEKGDGSDVMGIADGPNYRPNSASVIDTTTSYNLRPFRYIAADVDGDGKQEIVFSDRAGSTTASWRMGVISVSDVPDNGDTSETWTIEYSGKGVTAAAGTYYDVAVVDSNIYYFTTSGHVQAVLFRAGAYTLQTFQSGLIPSGSWKSSMVLDIDNNGSKEIVVAGNANGGQPNDIFVCTIAGDSLVATKIANLGTLGGGRGFGGAYGDIDNDGNVDFVFGARGSTPTGTISRVSYLGGSITSMASYETTIIDQGFGGGGERYDYLSVFNADGDADLEVLFGAGYGGNLDVPLVVLDQVTVPAAPTSIATIRTDTDGDGVPDSLNAYFSALGTVVSFNVGGASYVSYAFQDATGGINLYRGSTPGTNYQIGDRFYVTGKLIQYNGLDELQPDSMALVIPMGPVYSVSPTVLTLTQFLAAPETYESRYIKITGIGKKSGAWPVGGASANLTYWDGYNTFTVRVDSDTDIDGTTAPVDPVDIVGTGAQFDGSLPHTSGYQLFPNSRASFTEGVVVSPNRNFDLVTPADGSTITLSDGFNQTFNWNRAVDLNGDALQYQWVPVGGSAVATGNSAADSFLVRTGEQLKTFLGANDSVVLRWTVLAKDAGAAVSNLDTFSVTIKRGTITGVPTSEIPTEFSLQQNFPNPFNPTTTLSFGLPQTSNVTLRVYNLLGQEIVTLVNDTRSAGWVNVTWNGRDQFGTQVSSGTYLYRIEARPVDGGDIFVQNKKMMLLK